MPKRLEKRHPLSIRWFHWINFPVLATLVWSGLLIYYANDVYNISVGGHRLFHFFPERFYKEVGMVDSSGYSRLAEGIAWHFVFVWFFALNGLLYVLFLAFSGQWRHLVPRKGSLRNAWQTVLYDLGLSKTEPAPDGYNGAQRFAYTGVVVMALGSTLTGLAIWKPVTFRFLTALFGGYQLARFWHFWLMIFFCLFFAVHIVQVVRAGWNNFRGMITGYQLVPAPPDTPQSEA